MLESVRTCLENACKCLAQLTNAYSVIFSEGIYRPLELLKRSSEIEAKKLLKKEDALKIKKILFEAVKNGTGYKANLKNYDVFGKTGTARIFKNNKYNENIHNALFIGMAEIEEKEYLIGLIVKDPKKNGNGGGDVAAPIFSKILNTIEKFWVMSEINKNISLLRKNNFTGFTENSNFVEKDFVFLSFEQDKKIASKHASEAKKNGAKIIISKVSNEKDSKILNLIDKNLSANKEIYLKYLFNRNLEDLSIVGITGTNGKSSTAFFLHQFLLNSGFNPTLLTNIPEIPIKNCEVSPLTTPGNFLLHHYLKKSIDLKRDFFVMEVSSHSINQERIKGLNFKSKSLTSFSKDHLDYHKSIDDYRNTKESFLFEFSSEIFASSFNVSQHFLKLPFFCLIKSCSGSKPSIEIP